MRSPPSHEGSTILFNRKCQGPVRKRDLLARIPRVIFGVSIASVSRVKDATLMRPSRDAVTAGGHSAEVTWPIWEDKGLPIHHRCR